VKVAVGGGTGVKVDVGGGTGVKVDVGGGAGVKVAVGGGTGVKVAVGGTGVTVRVAVGGTGVFVDVGGGTGVKVDVGGGTGVKVDVGGGTGVKVDVGGGAGVKVDVGGGAGVKVAVGGTGVTVRVAVGGTGVFVDVGGGTGVFVGVAVFVGVIVAVAVGVGEAIALRSSVARAPSVQLMVWLAGAPPMEKVIMGSNGVGTAIGSQVTSPGISTAYIELASTVVAATGVPLIHTTTELPGAAAVPFTWACPYRTAGTGGIAPATDTRLNNRDRVRGIARRYLLDNIIFSCSHRQHGSSPAPVWRRIEDSLWVYSEGDRGEDEQEQDHHPTCKQALPLCNLGDVVQRSGLGAAEQEDEKGP
jgi:hypothetical protein